MDSKEESHATGEHLSPQPTQFVPGRAIGMWPSGRLPFDQDCFLQPLAKPGHTVSPGGPFGGGEQA